MRRLVLISGMLLSLAACGHTDGTRAVSGGLIGAGGIGQVLFDNLNSFAYRQTSAIAPSPIFSRNSYRPTSRMARTPLVQQSAGSTGRRLRESSVIFVT